MRSLASLLDAAVRRSASEVLLESGQPVVFTTTRGPESEQNVLPRTELFDMIVAAVDDGQQIELAVGNPVEFTIDAGGSWSVYAEPGMEGMTVRARREAGGASLDIELEEAHAFGPGEFRATGFASDAGLPGDDDEFEVEFDPDVGGAGSGRRPRSPNQAPPSQLYVEALDAPLLQEADGEFSSPRSTSAAPFESGTWALADEEDFEVGLDEPVEDTLPTGFPAAPPSSSFEPEGTIGVPDDDDDESPFDSFSEPFAAPIAAAPIAAAAKLPAAKPPAPKPDTPTRREITAASESGPTTRRELGSLGSPDADTRRELPTVGRGRPALDDLPASIGEGALVYVHEFGLAETLAQSFAAPSITIDDQISADEVWGRIRGLPIGAIVIVRREDPSALLGWILRRLEEGYRVFIETRARTSEGARRILLGVGASDRAERWLDSQVAVVIEPGETGPRVRRTN